MDKVKKLAPRRTIQIDYLPMNELKKLIDIADRLLAECPWHGEQTVRALQPFLLEEAHELIEAMDGKEGAKIGEELGDLLYALILLAKLGEKEGTFTWAEVLESICEKLVRRHPHVFGEQKGTTLEELFVNWEKVKQKEGKKSPIANIPPTLPALARAQKVIHKLQKEPLIHEKVADDLGQRLWDLVKEAEKKGVDAEGALRRTCLAYEEKHRRGSMA